MDLGEAWEAVVRAKGKNVRLVSAAINELGEWIIEYIIQESGVVTVRTDGSIDEGQNGIHN